MKPKHCAKCGSLVEQVERGGFRRWVCTSETCDYVFWNNPTPTVAAIVEYGDAIALVRSIGWPEGWFGLVTGFLEFGEHPDKAVLREVKEELNLEATEVSFVGHYTFRRMNQIILAYHVKAIETEISIDTTELEDYKLVPISKIKPWASGTGFALQDWLRSKGIEREAVKFGQ